MWLKEEKLYYQSLIETTTEEEKHDVASGTLKVLCSSESDGLQSLMKIINF